MDWRAIETAPQDGVTPVLVCCRTVHGPQILVAQFIHWQGGRSEWCQPVPGRRGFVSLGFEPTHWMPQPPMPEGL